MLSYDQWDGDEREEDDLISRITAPYSRPTPRQTHRHRETRTTGKRNRILVKNIIVYI